MAPKDQPPPDNPDETEAAPGGPFGMGGRITYATAAERLLDNGYQPLPINPGQKHPPVQAWTTLPIDLPNVTEWTRQYPYFGVGLRTGRLVGLDIDILDPDLAHLAERLAIERFGDTLVRVGFWPKRLLLYRTDVPFSKVVRGSEGAKIEVLGQGQQFVAFGRHPDTGADYYWPRGETPFDVALDSLPPVDEAGCRAFLEEAAALLGLTEKKSGCGRSRPAGSGTTTRDEHGLVADGRDGWLSVIAYHAIHDALESRRNLDPEALARIVWQRFAASTDLSRPRKDGRRGYGPADAAGKVADKLQLLRQGRLPPRVSVEAEYQAPPDDAAAARATLDAAIADACRSIEAWHREPLCDAPQLGLRATVGLGKSQLARRHVVALQARLRAAGLPHRLLVLTPALDLADETAAGWRAAGADVAVLRGYLARDPVARKPMCADVEAVNAAIAAGSDIHATACVRGANRCTHFDGCRKQANRRAVEAADVVVAAYDVVFSGLAVDAASIGVILIDEGCWARAARITPCTWDDSVPNGVRTRSRRERAAADTADLLWLRQRLSDALGQLGVLDNRRVRATGLTEADCLAAAALELARVRETGLFPGMAREARQAALAVASANQALHARATVWRALAEQLRIGCEGRVRVVATEPSPKLTVHEVKPVHVTLQGKPVLHLDATLRPALARTVLPRLSVQEIDAAAPHMNLTLVQGSFGKTSLCPNDAANPAERQRRANRLGECVDYVRWQARRLAPGRLLVVTYQSIEAAFADIPGVETAHFNNVAGLDCYRDVAGLVVIGRPLPRDTALLPLAAAYFGVGVTGGYRAQPAGVRMRDGSSRTVRLRRHEDPQAELLRAAICDDELIQAIGRGRGVNRTAADPLEVHVLADVALPLVHDRVLPWAIVRPDLFQRMLLEGIAVDSPGDAAALHSGMFSSRAAAEKAFQREAFGGHFPSKDPYREMSVKSAAYRRLGRGRSWQRAWWLEGDPARIRDQLEAVLGPLGGWKPDEE